MSKLCAIMFASMFMDSEAKHLLMNRFVLFSCEGAAEGAVIQSLYDNDLMIVPHNRVVKDAVMVNRPYTRIRKAADIAEQYFTMSYEAEGAEGLLIARVVDSRSPKFELPKRKQNGTKVLSFFTRPEIEMLVIHREGAYLDWQNASRKDRQLKPSDYCKGVLDFGDVKSMEFLKSYWADSESLVRAIKAHAQKVQRGPKELLLADLLR